MKLKRRLLVAALAAAPIALASALPQALAQQPYGELNPPQPVETQDKIEVIEFFWYGCIHCYNLEPAIERWEPKLAPDVQFRRVPAVFNARWAHDAAIYYALEALGALPKLHRPLFDAIHKDRLRTDDPQALAQWLQKHGVDPKKFTDLMKSFGVQSKVRRAAQLTVSYRVEGTPSMAVQGRYTVSADQARTRDGMLEAVDYLIDVVRKKKS